MFYAADYVLTLAVRLCHGILGAFGAAGSTSEELQQLNGALV